MKLMALVALMAAPFWESKAPEQWSDEELVRVMTGSPWAQMAAGPANAPPVQIFLATAAPIEQAEAERERRLARRRPPDAPPIVDHPLAEEYRAWLAENRATHIVLAVRVGNPQALSDASETRQMEEACLLRMGRKKLKLAGHFPPSPRDPYLRLAFPREVEPNAKTLVFELYVPGLPAPFRNAEFSVKELVFHGKLEL